MWNGKSCQEFVLCLGVKLTSSMWSCWNLSPISRSLRPICTSTLRPACSTGLSAILSSSCPLSCSSSSSSSSISPRSSMGSKWAGKCERNPALPGRKNIMLIKICCCCFKTPRSFGRSQCQNAYKLNKNYMAVTLHTLLWQAELSWLQLMA